MIPRPVAALFRVALRAWPPHARARFGADLEDQLTRAWLDEAASRGRLAQIRIAIRLSTDTIASGAGFRADERHGRRGTPATPSRTPLMHGTLYDVRLAARSLIKARGFSMTAVLILALGIAATTTAFGVANAVLFTPLPFRQPQRLATIGGVLREAPDQPTVASPGDIQGWREGARSFESIAVFNLSTLALDAAEGRERVAGVAVTANYFDVLGVAPRIGRGFRAGEDVPGSERVIVISDALWRRHFDADPAIAGRTLRSGTNAFTILGVMPPGFRGPEDHYFPRSDYWTTLRVNWATAGRGGHYLRTVARLRDGVTIEQARAEIAAIADRASAAFPSTNEKWTARVLGLQEELVRDSRPTLLLLLAGVGLLHLTVCANLASLLLSRGVSRQREFAIRTAIGATRARIVRSILAESLLLSVAGAAAGVGLAAWLLRATAALLPDMSRSSEFALSGPTVAFAASLALLTALLFGAMPAIRAASQSPWAGLRSGGRGSSGAATGLRRLLVAGEVAVSVMLLVAAGLLVRTVVSLASEPRGFSARNVETARLQLPADDNAGATARLAHALVDQIAALPGVEAAGTTTSLPLYGLNNVGLGVKTRTTDGERELGWSYRAVTPGYFDALKLELIEGRLLSRSDVTGMPGAVVINDAAARLFGTGSPIGRPVHFDFGDRVFDGAIVGVVRGVRHESLGESPAPEFYVPYAQHPVMDTLFLALRTGGRLPDAQELKALVHRVDPRVTIDDVQVMQTLVNRAMGPQRLNALLLTALSALALVLAVVGLYAVIAQTVAQRVREIGIRLALGANRSSVSWLVMRDGLTLTAAGVAAGMIGAWAAARIIARLLYAVPPRDPATFITVAALLLVVAAAASFVPARRASCVDPIVSLRCD